jgi:hypothetical protein
MDDLRSNYDAHMAMAQGAESPDSIFKREAAKGTVISSGGGGRRISTLPVSTVSDNTNIPGLKFGGGIVGVIADSALTASGTLLSGGSLEDAGKAVITPVTKYLDNDLTGNEQAAMMAQDISIGATTFVAGALAMAGTAAVLGVSAPAIAVGVVAAGGAALLTGYTVDEIIEYGQDIDFVAVGDNIGDAIQTSMTAINGLGGEMKAGALALTADIQELSGNVMEGMAETFDDLKGDYQKAGGISGMFNSAVSSVQNTLASTFNSSAENNVVATVEHQPNVPGMAV